MAMRQPNKANTIKPHKIQFLFNQCKRLAPILRPTPVLERPGAPLDLLDPRVKEVLSDSFLPEVKFAVEVLVGNAIGFISTSFAVVAAAVGSDRFIHELSVFLVALDMSERREHHKGAGSY